MKDIAVFSPDGINNPPGGGVITNGYESGDKLPASNFNYFTNAFSLLVGEAANVLDAAGITPDEDIDNQLLQSINILIGNAVIAQSWKAPVIVATTANITLSGEQTIDGVLTSSSRVLVKNQSDQKQNGIYVSAAGAWSRATDADSGAEIVAATMIVEQGTVGAQTQWTNNNTSITIGATNITFVKTPALLYSAGTGLTLTGNVFSLTAPVSLANGGTGLAAGSANAAFNALSPLTTLGDSLYGGASGAGTRLAGNITTTRKFWSQTGTGVVSAAPTIDVLLTGDIPTTLSGSRLFTGVVSFAPSGAYSFNVPTNTDFGTLTVAAGINAADAANGILELRQVGGIPGLFLNRLDGTNGSPTHVVNGNIIGQVLFGGYDGTNVYATAGMEAESIEDWANSGSHRGTNLNFYVQASATAAPTQSLTLGATEIDLLLGGQIVLQVVKASARITEIEISDPTNVFIATISANGTTGDFSINNSDGGGKFNISSNDEIHITAGSGVFLDGGDAFVNGGRLFALSFGLISFDPLIDTTYYYTSNGQFIHQSSGVFIAPDGSDGITGTLTTGSLVGKTLTFKGGIITGFA